MAVLAVLFVLKHNLKIVQRGLDRNFNKRQGEHLDNEFNPGIQTEPAIWQQASEESHSTVQFISTIRWFA